MEIVQVNCFIKDKDMRHAEWVSDKQIMINPIGLNREGKITSRLSKEDDSFYQLLDSFSITFTDFDHFFEFAKNNPGFKTFERHPFPFKKKKKEIHFLGCNTIGTYIIDKKNFAPTIITFEFLRYTPSFQELTNNWNIKDFYSYCEDKGINLQNILANK